MAEKSAKKKPKKTAKADPGVLGTLSASRPTRLGGERRGATTRARPAAKPATASKPTPKAPAKKAAATKSSAKVTAKPKATSAPKKAAPPAGWQAPEDGAGQRDGGPAELVTTAAQAAGELAQIGLTVGRQILKRAANRIPGR